MIFKNPFYIKKYTFTLCVGCVWLLIYVYFLFEKQAFNGLLQVTNIITILTSRMCDILLLFQLVGLQTFSNLNIYQTNFYIRSISIWHSLFGDIFLSGCCLHFISPLGRFYKELKKKSSLSLSILPFTLSPFHLSLSLLYLSLWRIKWTFSSSFICITKPSSCKDSG